jgi:NDP-sugar pyrophosphorylase family protein
MSTEKDFFAHESAYIDEGCSIGKGTKIWHFSHVMPNCILGENCNIGQNVVISPNVTLGRNVKVQNNVSIYTGVICEDDVFLGPSMVFTNVINPRSAVNRKMNMLKTTCKKRSFNWCQCYNCLWKRYWRICFYWCRCSCHKISSCLCPLSWKPRPPSRMDE